MGGMEERLKNLPAPGEGEKPPKVPEKNPLEGALRELDKRRADDLLRKDADAALLDRELDIKDKRERLKQLSSEAKKEEPKKEETKKEHKFSVIEGRVVPDPDGELTLTEALKLAADERAAAAGTKSFMGELDELLGGVLKQRLADLLSGGGKGQKENPEDELLKSLGLRKKVLAELGVQEPTTANIPSGEIKSDLDLRYKIALLQDETEKLRIQKEYEAKMAAAGTKAEEAAFIRPLISEGIGAMRETAAYYNKRAAAKAGGVGTAGEQKTKKKVICPNPECKKPFLVEADYQGKITCPHCEKVTTV